MQNVHTAAALHAIGAYNGTHPLPPHPRFLLAWKAAGPLNKGVDVEFRNRISDLYVLHLAPGQNGTAIGAPGVPGTYSVPGAPNIPTNSLMHRLCAVVLRHCVRGTTLQDTSTDIIRICMGECCCCLFWCFLLLLFSWQALSMVTLRRYVHNGRGLAVGRHKQKIKIRTVWCPEFKNAPQRKAAHLNRNESCTNLHVSETLYLLRSSVA